MSNLALKAENIAKAYQLGEIGTGTLSRDLERWWASIRGKEDPFLRIGESNDRTTKGGSDVVWSLKDINFEIQKGDTVGVIGRNGAGKSTLLKILSRVTSPTTGKITGNGRIASLLEVGTGFHPELTGRENIFLNGAILGMRRKEIVKKLDEIIDFAGVERYVDTPVKRYSSGMYVRLAFAVAAHLESETLIVDEVLAVGDAEFQKKCLGKMDNVSKDQGRTILFVSHNMESILSFCKRGILLKNGSIDYIGTAVDTVHSYRKVETLTSSEVLDYRLCDILIIKYFRIDKSTILSHDDLNFELSIANKEATTFSSIALFIYDEYDQKTAFIDLRKSELFDKSYSYPNILLKGKLEALPLLPGSYKIGLHVQSTTYYGDAFSLLSFEVLQKSTIEDIMPYPISVRGKIELQYSFDYMNNYES